MTDGQSGFFEVAMQQQDRQPQTVMLVAGEASGDAHAAAMFLQLKKRLPGIRGIGMGGQKMARAGIDVRFDSSQIGVIGVIEVLKHYREIRAALRQMQKLVADERPDLLICVDYKEFNFKLARHARRCGVKVLFYVSPQVWAWRPGRAKKYGRVIDMMAVIFPFETPYYQEHDIPVRYVGHPSVDKVVPQRSRSEDRRLFALPKESPVVGILPGSRSQEIRRMLPVMLQAADDVQKAFPGCRFLLPQADSISDELLQAMLQDSSVAVQVIRNQPYDVIQCCDAVMITSGTATLETALLTVPMVIVYKLSTLTYLLGRWLVKSPFIGLPNIVAGKAIVRELIQHQARAETLAGEIKKILADPDYAAKMRRELGKVRQLLGPGGGDRAMAELAEEMLRQAD